MPMLDEKHPFADVIKRDDRYHVDSYFFVFEALRYAQDEMGLGRAPAGDDDDSSDADSTADTVERHVSGQQLCEAIRRFALDQYGLLARSVLRTWGIRRTSDFGEIVFNLIDIKKMRKTDSDRREDFDDVFDFESALRDDYRFGIPE